MIQILSRDFTEFCIDFLGHCTEQNHLVILVHLFTLCISFVWDGFKDCKYFSYYKFVVLPKLKYNFARVFHT